MADERWRGAVEGYLNNQKYYLLVEPGHYQEALNIYDRLKKEAEYRAFGLVDIGKLTGKRDASAAARQSGRKGGDRKQAGTQLCGLSSGSGDMLRHGRTVALL